MKFTLQAECPYCLVPESFKAPIKCELGTTNFYLTCSNCRQEYVAEARLKLELTTCKKINPSKRKLRVL